MSDGDHITPRHEQSPSHRDWWLTPLERGTMEHFGHEKLSSYPGDKQYSIWLVCHLTNDVCRPSWGPISTLTKGKWRGYPTYNIDHQPLSAHNSSKHLRGRCEDKCWSKKTQNLHMGLAHKQVRGRRPVGHHEDINQPRPKPKPNEIRLSFCQWPIKNQ